MSHLRCRYATSARRMTRRATLFGLSFLVFALFSSSANASFGIEPGSFSARPSNADGTVDRRAGSHPYAYTVHLAFNQDSKGNAEGSARDVIVKLPVGLIGDPTAVPQCPREDLEALLGVCPADTQIGTFSVVAREPPSGAGLSPAGPVFNLVPPPGVAASIGFAAAGFNAIENASLVDEDGTYKVSVATRNVPLGHIATLSETIWGVPADPGHNPERQCVRDGKLVQGCESEATARPFLSLPSQCSTPLSTAIEADSTEAPGVFLRDEVTSRDLTGQPVDQFGCESLPFTPTLTFQPESTSAATPTGVRVDLHVPQNETVGGLAEANLRDAVVTLPPGLSVNPSSASALQGCSPAQIDLHGPEPANCPDASKIGSVEVDTPLVSHPLPGAVYLASQGYNPFHSLLAIYIAVNDPITGVVVKLAGHVEPDPTTGQLTTTFAENPQVSFEDFKLSFFGGDRAPLVTPDTCGVKTTSSVLVPWSAPQGDPVVSDNSFAITSGPRGTACANSVAEEPNRLSFEAGTTTPIAGTYSPFVLKLSREPGSQRISSIDTTLPEGLLGKLAGIPYCSDANIAAATVRRNPGEGVLERSSPSCPQASEVGTVNVGAGSGTPFYVQGDAYLAGPYKGAPLSLAIITPAVAGPFDLGTVVVRTALYVNETTAQIHAVSDPIPSILAGIPLDIRSVALNMSRPSFTLNPTSCAPKQITGSTTSTLGNVAPLQQRFQVGACNALGFKPNLAINLKGGTKRHSFPALKAVVTYPKGSYANIKKASVTLPHSEFLEQGHIGTVCTRVQFSEGSSPGEKCPKASIYGKARAFSPLLDKPLEGPVFLRSSSHNLPDLVADLKGQINVVLDGRIDSVKGQIRNTFDAVPDAPVSKFVLEMQGGKKGLLVNSANLCRSDNHATVKLDAQNGKAYDTRPVVGNGCGGKGHHG